MGRFDCERKGCPHNSEDLLLRNYFDWHIDDCQFVPNILHTSTHHIQGGVTFLLYTEIFSSESKTSHFNRAVDEVRTNPRAQELLGPGNKIQAFGETTWNKWARARPIASTIREDRNGQQHFLMHFSVKGPRASGVVNVHMVKNVESSEFEYKLLTLDVHGQPRIYLRNADAPKAAKKPAFRLFGVQWR